MPLDKIQVARRQLGTAVALFIEDLDPISVHTLACAGGEIAEHLARKKGKQPFAVSSNASSPTGGSTHGRGLLP
jgi:predicted HD phosphohydrolase